MHRTNCIDSLVLRVALRLFASLLHEMSVELLYRVPVCVGRELRIAPMPDKSNRRVFRLHHAEHVEVHLRDAHSIDTTRRAAVLAERLPPVLVRVRPAKRRARGIRLRAVSEAARAVELRIFLRSRQREILLRLVVHVETCLFLPAVQELAAIVVVGRREVIP